MNSSPTTDAIASINTAPIKPVRHDVDLSNLTDGILLFRYGDNRAAVQA